MSVGGHLRSLSGRMHTQFVPLLLGHRICATQPDFLVILAWNFGDEIMAQQEEYRRRGGRFILPVPHPEIVS